jgi:transposase
MRMPQFVRSAGIDCGKRFLDVAVHGGETIRLRNEPVDHQRLVVWLKERGVTRVGLEASGGYERAVRDVLCAAGLEVHVLDPARVRHFAKAKGRRAKTDPIDARVIAEFTATLVDTPPVTVEPAREDLAKLIRARRLLVAKRADMAKAVKDLPDAARTAVETALASLSAAIEELEALIDRQAGADAALAGRVEALCGAPGIGRTTAVAVAVLLPELGRVSGRAIAALLGVAPYADDSGDRKGGRHIAGGREDVRQILYMSVLRAATQGQGVLRAFYVRLTGRGKPAKVALTACMHKMIVRLNAMLAADQTWTEEPA